MLLLLLREASQVDVRLYPRRTGPTRRYRRVVGCLLCCLLCGDGARRGVRHPADDNSQ